MRFRLLAFAAVLFAAAPAARAQSPDSAPAFLNLAGVNLIGLPFGLVSAEFEHIVSPGFVIGAGGTYENVVGSNKNDIHTSWVEAKAKYYPNEESFKGFSVGLTLGVLHTHGAPGFGGFFGSGSYDGGDQATQSRTAPTVGVVLDYNWLLGRRKKLYVGTGIGAKRAFGTTGGNSILDPVYPYGRLQIGIAY
jgi:hypothetical protein